MKNSPRVSIVVNNYNYAEFVGEAISSALNQTYGNMEVIVVDDGSTDDSRNVIAQFRDKVVTLYKENGGQASAFNHGFANCEGDIIIFLDADDVLKPTAVECAVASLRSSGAIKVHWKLEEIDAGGKPLGRQRPHKRLPAGNYLQRVLESGPICLNQPPTSGNAWSREFLHEVMPIFQFDDKHGADGFLRRLAPIYGELGVVDQPQGYYRVHRRNFSGRNKGLALQILLKRFPIYLDVVSAHLTAKGFAVDREKWLDAGSAFACVKRLADLHGLLMRTIPEGDAFLFMDQGELGSTFLEGRVSIPFLDHCITTLGDSLDEHSLIQSLESQIANGVVWLVVAYTAFPCRDRHPLFFRHLERHCHRLHEDQNTLVYDLTGTRSPKVHTKARYGDD